MTTETYNKYYEDNLQNDEMIKIQIMEAIINLEQTTGKKFGDLEKPLLVTVRSGSRTSNDDMIETVLNCVLKDEVDKSDAKNTENARFIYDSYRRFIQMFADDEKGY